MLSEAKQKERVNEIMKNYVGSTLPLRLLNVVDDLLALHNRLNESENNSSMSGKLLNTIN